MWFLLLLLSSFQAPAGTEVMDDVSIRVSNQFFRPDFIPEEPALRFFKTEGEDWLIGLQQVFLVHASADKVAKILDDIQDYPGIFTDLKRAKYTEFKSIDDYTLFTETKVSIPFLPNDKTEMVYHVKRSNGRIRYRYSLKKGNNLKRYEGVILVAPLGENDSLYFEYDAYEPDLGIGKMAGQEKVWVESAVSNLQSDWAVKIKAQHPTWSNLEVLTASEDKADSARRDLRKLYLARASFSLDAVTNVPAAPTTTSTEKNPEPPKN